jgi:hypothetical protein
MIRAASTLLILCILSACGETAVKEAPKSTGGTTGSSLVHPELIGTWTFDCKLPQNDNPSEGVYRYTGELQITKDQMIYTQIAHYDNECKQPAFRSSRTDSYVPKGLLTGSKSVYKWDWKLVSLDQSALNEWAVSTFNTEKLFGYSDWKTDVPKSILGRKMSSESKAEFQAGSLSFMIYKIEDGVGYFKTSDAVNDGNSEAQRKVGLDSQLKFKKKTKLGTPD